MLPENLSLEFPTRSDTIQAVQQQKMARDLKFQVWEEEELYYLCSNKKGAYQLTEADLIFCRIWLVDLCLCFRICKKQVFFTTQLICVCMFQERERKQLEVICLIPELCYMTGLTDALRQDFRVMKVSNINLLISSPEPKAHGELIVYQSSRRLSVCLCVCLCVHIFKHEYL